ncbi:MAG TPA: hypothetical protein VHC98_02155 [Candidatus Saccharimonadales bacterium]|nr:hypothetical protein [Candidatus Saccharimonadales bacterium]
MMGSHVIELNGKRYDAATGQLLGDAPAVRAVQPAQVMGRNIDGVHRGAAPRIPHAAHVPARALHGAKQQTAAPAPHRPAAPMHPGATVVHPPAKAFDIHRPQAQQAAARHLQHSKTLMRTAVHRPDASLKRRVKAVTRTDILVKTPLFEVLPKHSVQAVDEKRLHRAQRVAKSKLITRFGNVHFQPMAQPTMHASISLPVSQPKTTALSDIVSQPRPARQPSADVFERALAIASSHREPPHPVAHHAKRAHRGRRVASIAASSLAILLIIGFIGYQNAASLQLRVASARAGINASLPTWRPSGYRIGSLSYSAGKVTVSFRSTTAVGHDFSLTQTASSWDSATLLSNFVYPNNDSSYDTINAAGSTIYTYGNNNATWVSGGIWYRLTSNGNLSNSQIVRLATSM